MCSGSEAGSYLRLIDSCVTQLEAQGPPKTSNESDQEEEEEEEEKEEEDRASISAGGGGGSFFGDDDFVHVLIPGSIPQEYDSSPGHLSRYRGTSLIRMGTTPRTAIWPHAFAYCGVLGGGVFLGLGTPVAQFLKERLQFPEGNRAPQEYSSG